MLGQIVKARIVFHQLSIFNGKKRLHQSAINLTSQNSHLSVAANLSLIPSKRYYCASTSATKPDQKLKDAYGKEPIERSLTDMDHHLDEIIQFLEQNSRSQRFKTAGLTLFTVIAGVSAGAYAAHFGAWFLEKLGLFIFEDEEDD